MLVTTESTAWAVTFSAGLTSGVILGHGFTPQAVAMVIAIATLASCICHALLERIRWAAELAPRSRRRER